jgi:hypothetical protein
LFFFFLYGTEIARSLIFVVVAFTFSEARKVIILELGKELEKRKECNCATCHWDPKMPNK